MFFGVQAEVGTNPLWNKSEIKLQESRFPTAVSAQSQTNEENVQQNIK